MWLNLRFAVVAKDLFPYIDGDPLSNNTIELHRKSVKSLASLSVIEFFTEVFDTFNPWRLFVRYCFFRIRRLYNVNVAAE